MSVDLVHILKSIQYLTRAKNTLGRGIPNSTTNNCTTTCFEIHNGWNHCVRNRKGEKPVEEACILAVFIFVDLICYTPVSKQ